MFRNPFKAALAAALVLPALAAPLLAADVAVEDAYARSSNPRVGGIFMMLKNSGQGPARLVEARSDVAAKVELHTHLMEDGIAKMRPVEAIEIPAQGMHALARGGDHVMLMGLKAPLAQGDSFPLTLVFDDGDSVELTVTVDNERQDAAAAGGHGHGGMKMPAAD